MVRLIRPKLVLVVKVAVKVGFRVRVHLGLEFMVRAKVIRVS